MMSHRPFEESMAVTHKHWTGSTHLNQTNTHHLNRTALSRLGQEHMNEPILPQRTPRYLNSACVPFVQEYFSVPSYERIRQSGESRYSSAVEAEEHR